MISPIQRSANRERVHARIRRKMQGTAERPRLNVYRSLNQIYTQLVDDQAGTTLAAASSLSAKLKTGGNVAAAKEVGKLIAEKAKEKGMNGNNEEEAGSRAIQPEGPGGFDQSRDQS